MERGFERLQQFIADRRQDVSQKSKWREGYADLIHTAIDSLDGVVKPGNKILDVGFGNGYALDVFKQKGMDTYGITMSEQELENQSSAGHNVYLMDMSFLSFDDSWFDLVWARHSLEHSLFPYFTLSEFYRVLKTGGTLFVEVPAPKTAFQHENFVNHYSVLDKLMWVSLIRRTGFNKVKGIVLEVSESPKATNVCYRFIARKAEA